ncbi:Vacuolar protein sorting/targeting protein 10 [Thelohanellus kitauei]|uniref:Vacuolar protein sorting/targeting protein 10 n=1 Tax=Thelohanellus kitauei TaxID=669202 RepID=A0A0C2I5D6_THEKT|nr:Vacuolar protein sorting/targeting protein 10 [Thelohanellus kitauei]
MKNLHTFISFNYGVNWKIVTLNIQKLIFVNRGGILLRTIRKSGRIWYSYDYGFTWRSIQTDLNNLVNIMPIESSNDPIITAINYDKKRTCETDDYEPVYVRRYSGTCYQGNEVYLMKKKRLAVCFDNRTLIIPTHKPCPCSLEDFDWYPDINHSKPNYYYKQSICVFNPLSIANESNKICSDGAQMLNNWNGYD